MLALSSVNKTRGTRACVQIQPALRVNGRNREASGCTRNYRTGCCPRSAAIRSENFIKAGFVLNTDFYDRHCKILSKKKNVFEMKKELFVIFKEVKVDGIREYK